MAKRKPNQPHISADVVRNVGLIVIVALSLFFLISGLSAYAVRSGIFTIKDIVVAENLGTVDVSDFSKLKGQSIFAVRLEKFEARIRNKYPALSNLRVTRRFRSRATPRKHRA